MKGLSIKEIAEMMEGTVLCGDPSLMIREYSFSSKEGDAETLFLPTVGERVDAHDFIADAMHTGMAATVTERQRIEPGTESMTYLAVDNTRDALQRLGRAVRLRYAAVPMVAITGSVGKTTTKEMIYATLQTAGNVLKTEGNKNGQLGVPLMMLRLSQNQRNAVIEMGMSLFGEMERIARVAQPNYAVITNIGVSHIGNLLTQENIRREKLCIINQIQKPAIVFVNGDDPLLAELCPKSPAFKGYNKISLYPKTREQLDKVQFRSYGMAKWCDYRAENLEILEDGVRFDYCHEEVSEKVVLHVMGQHNVSNAIAAMAVAEAEGIPGFVAKRGLSDYRPMAMRGNVEQLSGGICLIDDTYNASPDSMKSGLDILETISHKGRKIAVLADILELGEQSERCHRLVGTYVAEHSVDILLTVGSEAREIAKEAGKKKKIAVQSFDTREEAGAYLLEILKAGDAVLLKGSRGMGLDRLAKQVREYAVCGCDY